jgi:HrpA-like RNA helicase
MDWLVSLLLALISPFHPACFVEYETSSTRAFFVTTGYLVRVLANNPGRFDDITYLIIDEVHERSVDTDILCLLCRRLLNTNPRIRLVLMSATLAAALYQEYFQVSEPVIKVGARRFPVAEVYLNDLLTKFAVPGKVANYVKALTKECQDMKCKRAPSMSYMEKLYPVVAYLATVVGKPGSSVLVFVSGMNDIVAITEIVDQLYVPGVTFTCFPIHSDIPFEDQMQVFDASKPDEVRIVIATNAAESSVTLPDIDHVICLGLCKQIVYNVTSHRQMLSSTWISRASATQRAGRTGRLRPGTVYRLYERESYDSHMDAFEPGEMRRIPLDSVILMLKQMLSDEDITQVLLSCLEPPDISSIDRSFESLFRSHFITSSDETCNITTLGSFVSALGIDLALGSLIGLGIQFGVGAEAIQMASILSFPKSAWIQSNPLIHEPANYNGKSRRFDDFNLWGSRAFSLTTPNLAYRQSGDNFCFKMPFRRKYLL